MLGRQGVCSEGRTLTRPCRPSPQSSRANDLVADGLQRLQTISNQIVALDDRVAGLCGRVKVRPLAVPDALP